MFDFLEKEPTSTELTVDAAKEDDDRESKVKIGAGAAIDASVQQSAAKAKVKYTKPEYNPQTRKQYYDDSSAHKAALDKAFSSGKPVLDPYTGKELDLKQRDAKIKHGENWQDFAAEADHIDPLHEFVNRSRKNPFLTTEDVKEIGNSIDDNFQVMSRTLNQNSKTVGKGGSSQEEWAKDPTRMEGVARLSESGESKESISKRAQDIGKAAKKRNDQKALQRSVKNAANTAHEAGKAGAQDAGVTALTMSGIMNVVSVIKGEKTGEEAIADTIKDGGKAAVTGYVMGGGMTVASQGLSSTSSEFLRGLAANNVPGKIITAVIVTGDTLKKWGEGEITTQECMLQLGEKGLNMVTTGYSMAVGQTLIPIPVVGAAVGALVGSMLTSEYYNRLVNELRVREIEHQERLRIIAESEEATRQLRAFRAELEEYLQQYFANYRQCFDEALSTIQFSFSSGDADGVIAGANEITRKLGGNVQYENVSEYKKFLDSGKVFQL